MLLCKGYILFFCIKLILAQEIMAEEIKDTVIDEKTPGQDAAIAPKEDKPVEQETETLDAEDIDDALTLLNIMDREIGGKGEIGVIPEEMRGSIKYLVEKLVFVRDLFEDPLWKSILDDMADQKEDGKTPSVEVAIARNIPLEKIQTLTESEDYEGVQGELSSNITAKKQSEEEEVEIEASFEESKKALDEYSAKMGYDEERINELSQTALDLFQILADGKISVVEWEKVDKMQNYDDDIEDLRSQIQPKEAKEVLPDKSSVDATIKTQTQTKQTSKPPVNTPGIGSMGAYNNVGTDITNIGKRKRGN